MRGKKMGDGNGMRGSIFSCLDVEKMGEERKGERKSGWATCPIFLPKFSSQNGGILRQIFCFHSLPSCFSHGPTLLLIKLSSSSTLFFHSGQPLTSQKLSFTVQPSNIPLLLFSTEPESFSHFTFFLYMRDTKF